MGGGIRTHFVVPREILEEFDRRVAPRKRSETVAELMAEWVRRERAKELLNLAGFVKAEDHPEWQTREDVYRWVRELKSREGDPWAELNGEDGQQ